MSKSIALGPGNPSGQIVTYGGVFDICNGSYLSERDICRIKTASLFFDKIIIFDGYMHSYGPIFNHISEILLSGKDPYQDEIVQLFEAGILVPALRTGESLKDNFANSIRGIRPGEFMTLPNNDLSIRVLGLIDECVHKSKRGCYAIQPESMENEAVIKFRKSASEAIFGEDARVSVFKYLNNSGLDGIGIAEKLKMLNLTESIGQSVYEEGFRRGLIEDKIRNYLNLNAESHLYESLIVACKSGNSLPSDIHVALYLLWVTSTVYELNHANDFGTIGGLFSSHEPYLFTKGVYDYFNDNISYSFESTMVKEDVIDRILDIKNLSVRDILDIRENEVSGVDHLLFDTYKSLFKEWISGPKSSTDTNFNNVQERLMSFLQTQYLPVIARKIAKAKSNNSRLTEHVFGTVSGLVAAVSTVPFITTLSVLGFPIGTLVAGYIGYMVPSQGALLTEKVTNLINAKRIRVSLNQYHASRMSNR